MPAATLDQLQGPYVATVNVTGVGNQIGKVLTCVVVTVNVARRFSEKGEITSAKDAVASTK
jgi:hypothetical protein